MTTSLVKAAATLDAKACGSGASQDLAAAGARSLQHSTVKRLMRREGLQGRSVASSERTTISDKAARVRPTICVSYVYRVSCSGGLVDKAKP